MIEPQAPGADIDVRLVSYRSVPRNEILSALIADIGLRGPQTAQIRRHFRPAGIHRNQVTIGGAASSLGQELLNYSFRAFILAFAKLVVPNTPSCINEI